MRLELPPLNSSTQFYRLQSQPAPWCRLGLWDFERIFGG